MAGRTPARSGRKGAKPSRTKSRDATTELLDAARVAAQLAHSPYSGLKVGAALRCRSGEVFTGCNVENASYGLTLCAERVAAVKAVSAGQRSFEAIAIVSDQPQTLMPCGACRQFLQEFAPDLRVVCEGTDGAREESRLSELLPRAFGPADLT
jgi:cytidine deaminase